MQATRVSILNQRGFTSLLVNCKDGDAVLAPGKDLLGIVIDLATGTIGNLD
jgi:hypothetical protein